MKAWIVQVVAILTIGGLVAYALHEGHNGATYSTGFTIIGGIAGYAIAKRGVTK